jgi:hypothetical protein
VAAKLEGQLAWWEEWAADVMESHLAYPMLAYFRSQHENQSWLGALVTILDASAVTLLCSEGDLKRQAELTLAMGRHALADLVSVFRLSPPDHETPDRLAAPDFQHLVSAIFQAKAPLDVARLAESKLRGLRQEFEPFAVALSDRLLMALPAWLPGESERDNWQRSSWGPGRAAIYGVGPVPGYVRRQGHPRPALRQELHDRRYTTVVSVSAGSGVGSP